MIKLTALHYKLKIPSLERYHSIAEHNAGLMFDWENEVERARAIPGSEYPKKPFIEPFEFNDDDYIRTELPFRIKKENIASYKLNTDNVVEVTVEYSAENITYTVKNTIEEIDALLGQ